MQKTKGLDLLHLSAPPVGHSRLSTGGWQKAQSMRMLPAGLCRGSPVITGHQCFASLGRRPHQPRPSHDSSLQGLGPQLLRRGAAQHSVPAPPAPPGGLRPPHTCRGTAGRHSWEAQLQAEALTAELSESSQLTLTRTSCGVGSGTSGQPNSLQLSAMTLPGAGPLAAAVGPILSSGCPRPTLPSILYPVLLPWHSLCSLGTA